MALRRGGRPLRRRFAGRKGGRRFFWYRFTPSGVTLRQASTATHSDIIVDEGFWQVQSAALNDQQRGGPRLERFFVDYGLAVDGDDALWAPSGDALIDLIPEFMVWKQSDQFATIVTDSASFDATREKQRIIMDEIPMEGGSTKDLAPGGRCIRWVRGRYETKSKVRLSDGALGLAWRGLFNEGSVNVNGYTDWIRCTFLISLP